MISLEEHISLEDLRRELFYDQFLGTFTWIIRKPRIHVGMLAGNIDHKGYLRVMIKGKTFIASRLAWYWMTGEDPEGYIDHKDQNKSNNRWNNLREATHSQNYVNSKNFGRMRGIMTRYYKRNGIKYRVRLTINGERKDLGEFIDLEEAIAFRKEKEREIWGEFACLR